MAVPFQLETWSGSTRVLRADSASCRGSGVPGGRGAGSSGRSGSWNPGVMGRGAVSLKQGIERVNSGWSYVSPPLGPR